MELIMNDKKVLIVEDEKITALFIEHFLSSKGCEIVGSVTNALDALKTFESKQPDIVLMDVILNGEANGIQCAEQMLSRNLKKLIFITSNSDAKTRESASKLGDYPYLIKPLDMKKLLDLIQN